MTENSESGTTVTKRQAKEVTIVHDEGLFCHDTGDTYNGFFEVKKKDKTVKMHGPGTYTTAEGDTYVGVWHGDKLGVNEEAKIFYSDGSRYEGFLKDWCYSGLGRYYYPDGSVLQCEFIDNSPVGNLTLTDPNGHIWLGKAEQGYCWLDPVNHYYDMLEKAKEIRNKRQHKTEVIKMAEPYDSSTASSIKLK
ncbi:unnamed protein product [Parnassius apollo]|uniref:(apollo) hypothetical protein n=1 Tax=Parnassius apollo TaxID=110799 RepID=A0A8S3WE69_PARAO|nr:unnamed protein product [Parnassius apollo]